MDKQNTPKQSKTSRRQTQVPPTNLSPTGSYIPRMPSPTDWVIPPSASVYDPNFFNTNVPVNQNVSFANLLPLYAGMLSQSNPMVSHSTPIPMPNIHEPRETQESSPDVDGVPETQPSPPTSPPPSPDTSKAKGKGKAKAKGKGKAKEPKEPNDGKRKFLDRAAPKPWTPEEEVELAKAWVATSEDSVVGNNRSRVDFWDTVRRSFEMRTGCPPKHRTVHQIRSKCVSLGQYVQKFSNIYNNIKSARKSGEGDTDWLTKARFRYQQEQKKSFNHEHVWDVLKGCEKYMRTPLIGATGRPKRSKTSESGTPTDASDAHGPFNVDDEDENEHEDEDEEEPPRPIGRNAARSSASGSTGGATSETVSGLLSELNTLNTTSRELLEARRKDLDLRERDLRFRESEADAKRERRDYRFYVASHAHLSGGALVTTLNMKEALRQKYGWPPLE